MLNILKCPWGLKIALAIPVLTIGCSELADWLACNMVTNPHLGKSCGVLVLGAPSHPDGKSTTVQKMRVATGVSAYRHYNCNQIFFSGAAVKNQIIESQTMAQLARGLGVQSDRIGLETQARSTWENIKFSIPKLEKYDSILITSDGLHAQRGRRYLCQQRPDLCQKTFVTVEYRLFDQSWWKILSGGYELFAWGKNIGIVNNS
jgi:uncharacterized SAM-binding protein YcdF (DUF218 family)